MLMKEYIPNHIFEEIEIKIDRNDKDLLAFEKDLPPALEFAQKREWAL